MLLGREGVGGIREGRGALVGGDDEIGVVAVMANCVRRRDDRLAIQVVGELEQGPNEDAVALGTFGEPGGAIGGRRQLLGHEAAFGADRDDDGILDLLGLDQPEHLGAEILRPVRPAQATAGDLAEAHMDAFDARRVDEDLVERARQRHAVDLAGGELERDRAARVPVGTDLEEVGAQRRVDQVDEAAQDAVLVEAGDVGERGFDALTLGLDLLGALIFGEMRIELGDEELHQPGGDAGVAGQRIGDVVLRIGRADLAQIAAERPQQGSLAPGKAGSEDELVEAVGFGEAAELRHQRRLDRRIEMLDVDLPAAGAFQRHVVQPDTRIGAGRAVLLGSDVEGALVDNAEAHILQHRHALGERDRGAAREQLEIGSGRPVAVAAIEIDRTRPLRRQLLQHVDVDQRILGRVALAIGGAEGLGIALGEGPGGGTGLLRVERVLEAVAPGADDRGDAGFQRVAVDLGRATLVAPDDVVGAGERSLRIGRIGGGDAALVDAGEEFADAPAHRGVVTILRDEDERRDEAVELVGAGERADARPLGQLHDVEGEALQRLDIDLEELVAREGVEHVVERATGIARRVEAGALEHARDLETQIRDGAGAAGIGVRGEQADDAQFAVEPPVGREQFHADIVKMDAAVDAALDVGLGDDQRLRLGQEGADLRRHHHELAILAQHPNIGIAQDAEAGGVDRVGGGVATREAIGAHAEQGEIVAGDPFEEIQSLGDLVLGQRRRIGAVGLDHLGDSPAHRGPVVDGEADIDIDAGKTCGEALAGLGGVDPVEMDVDQALAARALDRAAGSLAGERLEGAVVLAHHGEDRMGDEARLIALLAQFGQGRIEQERLVVVDHLEDRDLALAPIFLNGLVAEAQIRFAGLAPARQVGIGGIGGASQELRRQRHEILGDGSAIEKLGEVSGHRRTELTGRCLDRGDGCGRGIRFALGHSLLPPAILPKR